MIAVSPRFMPAGPAAGPPRAGGRRFYLLGAVLAVLVVPPAAAGGALDGRWRFLGDESDPIREQVVDNLEYVDRSNARLIETPRGREVLGVRTVRPTPESVDRLMALLDQVTPIEPLTRIETDGAHVTLTYADGRTRRVCTDCPDRRAAVQSTARKGPQKLVLAAWEDGALTIETNTNAGLSVVETFSRAGEGPGLHVDFTIDTSRFPEPVHSRHVYAPAGQSPGRDG